MVSSRIYGIKLLLLVGVLSLGGLLVTSCLSSIFNRPPEPRIAIAEGSPYGSAPLEVTFDISGSSDLDGDIVSFTFDFADGSELVEGTDLTQPITHTFTVPGQYFVTLTVVDDMGKNGLAQMLIAVSDASE